MSYILKSEREVSGWIFLIFFARQEVLKMIDYALHPMDKALIAALYETGCRIEEMEEPRELKTILASSHVSRANHVDKKNSKGRRSSKMCQYNKIKRLNKKETLMVKSDGEEIRLIPARTIKLFKKKG
jgi:hypothetical protein